MNSQVIRLCERIAAILGALAISASFATAQSPAFIWALSIGLLLGLSNLVGLRFVLGRLVLRLKQQYESEKTPSSPDSPPSSPPPSALGLLALLFFKVIAALVVVWLSISVWKLDPIGFGLGLSLVVGSLTVVPFIASTTLPEDKRVALFEGVSSPPKAVAPTPQQPSP